MGEVDSVETKLMGLAYLMRDFLHNAGISARVVAIPAEEGYELLLDADNFMDLAEVYVEAWK